MPSDYPHLRYSFDRKTCLTYRRVMKTLASSLTFDTSDVARFRLHVLEHYYKYGLVPTLDAFGVKKSTLYDWKKRFEVSGKKLNSLVPVSTKPKELRRMNTDWRLVELIKTMRKEYGNVGANILKPFVDALATDLNIPTISKTTITKIVKIRRLTFETKVKLKKKSKQPRLRTKRSPKVTSAGYVQLDCITLYINREKHLFVCCIDVFTKFALVRRVKSLSSQSAKQVLVTFEQLTSHSVHTVQTDNGSEFLGVFDRYLEDQGIKHIFTYPRSPRINGVVERLNRTVQKEFIKRSDEIYYNTKAFDEKLTKWLHWYNYQRPHYALKYLSPVQFINTQIPKSG